MKECVSLVWENREAGFGKRATCTFADDTRSLASIPRSVWSLVSSRRTPLSRVAASSWHAASTRACSAVSPATREASTALRSHPSSSWFSCLSLARVSSWRSCSRSADANFMLCVSKALCECEASRRSLSSSATSAARRDASLSPMFRATFSSSSNCLFFCVAWSSCCLACDCKRKVSVLYGQTVLGFIGKCNTYLPELGA
jgi:hypothetical protein